MKKLIIVLLVACCFDAAAQKPAQTPPKKDSVTRPVPVPLPQSQIYFLPGPLASFQLLAKYIYSPGDVTPNEVKTIGEWLNKNLQALPDSAAKK